MLGRKWSARSGECSVTTQLAWSTVHGRSRGHGGARSWRRVAIVRRRASCLQGAAFQCGIDGGLGDGAGESTVRPGYPAIRAPGRYRITRPHGQDQGDRVGTCPATNVGHPDMPPLSGVRCPALTRE